MGNLLLGKPVAEACYEALHKQIEELKNQNVTPHLAVVLVGNNPASETYVKTKEKKCKQLGIRSSVIRLAETISIEEVLFHIESLNNDITVHGILVQLPLPEHLDERVILERLHPLKDVDGFHALNVGRLVQQEATFVPCTPAGVSMLLKTIYPSLKGKHAVIIGRSQIVGKPLIQLLLEEDATVTVCHSKTESLAHFTKQADILIVAIGKAQYITPEMIKPGAVVIDVGINRLETGKLVGDVHPEVQSVSSHLTPVPGGVGPMTIAMLMQNTLRACQWQLEDFKREEE